LVNQDGLYGVIVANKWMRANYGEPLRKFLKRHQLYEIIDFGDLPVFESATTYPCIMIAGKHGKEDNNIKLTIPKTLKFPSLAAYVEQNHTLLNKGSLSDEGWILAGEATQVLLSKIHDEGIPLKVYVKGKILYGIKTGLNEAFVINRETRDSLIAEDPGSKEIIKPFLAGRDIKRYQEPHSEKFLIFAKRGIDIKKYPAILKHLENYKAQLTPKPKGWTGIEWKGRKPGNYKWYEIQDAVDYAEEFEKPKIIIPAIANVASYTLDEASHFSNDKTTIIPVNDLYLLGLLNSKLLDYYIKSIASTKQGGYYEYKPMYLSKIPIKMINESDKAEKQMQGEIIRIVEHIITLHTELSVCKLADRVDQIKSQINHFEIKINELVYRLYGLTEEEISILEIN
jgi:hypothetical protein